jgi:hypothetical protein
METEKYLLSKFFVILLLFSATHVISQESISTSGDHFQETTGTISWTLGETVTSTINSSSGSLTQGFNQPGVAELQAIPTMNQWGIAVCLLLFLIVGSLVIKDQNITLVKRKH